MSPAAPDALYAVVTLPTTDEARRFMRAAEEIEATIEGTSVKIVNTTDYVPGQGPPANETPDAGHWQMFGLIEGPEAEAEWSAEKRTDVLANWTAELVAILETFDLRLEKEVPS